MRSIETHYEEKLREFEDIRVSLSQLLHGFSFRNDMPHGSAKALREAYNCVATAESIYRLERQP